MLTANQLHLINLAYPDLDSDSAQQLCKILNQPDQINTCSDQDLIRCLEIANAAYRGGESIISDHDYDFVYLAELKHRLPEHLYLNRVEPESAFVGKTIDLPQIMLSTEKAYSVEEVQRWIERMAKAALEIDIDPVELLFKVTPKLDGYAAFDDGQILYTRGDGRKGTDISRVFTRGLQIANEGQRGLGAGEIVVSRSYFDAQLGDFFDNPRNFQASVIKEKELDSHAERAILEGAAVFYPFALLPAWTGCSTELMADFISIVKKIWHQVDYDVDGVVLEIVDDTLKNYLGATRHHHRWQLAFKENLDSAAVKVLAVTAQTSRNGRITPVVELEPVRLSGALLSRATAHHYGMVRDKGIGEGAIIQLARSGEVIPKIEAVLTAAPVNLPSLCPSCHQELVWDNDYLVCTNHLACPAQISNSMEHFFKVLKNNDGFGSSSIKKLYDKGIRRVDEIYKLQTADFEDCGFGPKQAQNLVDQLLRSRMEAVEDWRFLAALGVFRMGLGNCERLLSHYTLQDIFESEQGLSESDIVRIEGFAEKTAAIIMQGFKHVKPLYDNLKLLGFNLIANQQTAATPSHTLTGKTLVFTGSLQSGTRDELSKKAKACGAKIANSVSSKTDYLVVGENVGTNKLQSATEKGIQIITEQTFLDFLN